MMRLKTAMFQRWLIRLLTTLLLSALSSVALGQQSRLDNESLLDESEYRGNLEEVIITGQQPEWRQPAKQEEWRPDRFELEQQVSGDRLKWFPEYDKDERNQYQGVRDRTNEKPEFKIFEWKF
ncbi:MAG: hypothetical protein ACJAYG_000796 [Oceanicoccus sp.]|jgi:hypothetical protein